MSSRAGGGVYKVAIQLKDEGGVIKKLDDIQKKGVSVRTPRALASEFTPVSERVKSSEVRNVLRGAVDVGPGRKKSLPSSTGIEPSPSGGPTPIGVDFGGVTSKLGGMFGGLLSKLGPILGGALSRIPLVGPLLSKVGDVGKKLGGMGGTFDKIHGLQMGQLLKLGAIGVGIGAVLAVLAKSSGILQGSFKLLETSFFLALKPMADFLGLILRPIALAILTQLVIPFYKYAMPWFREWGPKIGEGIVALPETIMQGLQGLGKFFSDIGGGIATNFQLAGEGLQKAWDTFVTGLSTTLTPVPSLIYETLVNVGTTIWNTLSNIGQVFWGYLQGIGQSIFDTLQGIGSYFFGVLGSIGTSIFDALVNIPQIFWGYLQAIGQMIFDGLAGIPTTFVDIFTTLAINITSTLANVPEILKDAILKWLASLIPGGGGGGGNRTGSDRARTLTQQRIEAQAVADTF